VVISGEIKPSVSGLHGNSRTDTKLSVSEVVTYNYGKHITWSVPVVHVNFGKDTILFVSVLYDTSVIETTLLVTEAVTNGNPETYATVSVDVAVA
jgi:hypothetical protein